MYVKSMHCHYERLYTNAKTFPTLRWNAEKKRLGSFVDS